MAMVEMEVMSFLKVFGFSLQNFIFKFSQFKSLRPIESRIVNESGKWTGRYKT